MFMSDLTTLHNFQYANSGLDELVRI